jgi:twitching motility protein PilU
VPALEILLDTPRIKDLIKKAEIDTLKEAMEQGFEEGCQTFDRILLQLYKENRISLEQALINADSANNLRLKIKLEGLKGDEAVNVLLDKQTGGAAGDAFRIQGGGTGKVTPIRKR